MPDPPGVLMRLVNDTASTESDQSRNLRVQVQDSEVEMHPILGGLDVWDLLQQQLDAVTVRREQDTVRARARFLRQREVAQCGAPEFGCPIQIGAVEHDGKRGICTTAVARRSTHGVSPQRSSSRRESNECSPGSRRGLE